MVLLEVPRTVMLITILVFNVAILGLIAYIASLSTKPSSGGVNSTAITYVSNERIIGGGTAQITRYSFTCGLVTRINFKQLICGGSIVGKFWVITAGHCAVYFLQRNPKMFYFVSDRNKWRLGKRHHIDFFKIHENFYNVTMVNYIALVKVKEPFTGMSTRPIPIANENYKYETNRTVTVLGWGRLADDKSLLAAEDLYSVDVTIYDHGACTQMYKEVYIGELSVTDKMFCAGDYEGGKDACQCDSGGPIIDKNILIGIVSWAKGCGVARQPGVYTKISNYKDWILSVLKAANETIDIQFKS